MPGSWGSSQRVRVVGPGRAGSSLATALDAEGWTVLDPVHHGDDPTAAAHGTDLLVVATPDRSIAEVAEAIEPDEEALVVHLAGALGPGVLIPQVRRGALHPLVALPDPLVGADRLGSGAWFAIAADDPDDEARLEQLVGLLDGHAVRVAEDARVAYHAAAVVAANHLTALMGQVERIAATTGVPLSAFLELARQTLVGVEATGPTACLTGPVARGDWSTVARHLRALDEAERSAYAAMAECATRLVPGAEPPDWLAPARRDARAPEAENGHE